MDHTHHTSISSRLCSGSPYRRKRIIWLILIVLSVAFYYGAPWEIPGHFKDVTRANVVKQAQEKLGATSTNRKVNEIYGLLYLVTAPGNHQLSTNADEPIELGVYASGNKDLVWSVEADSIDRQFPVVAFSKTDCPYSAKVKSLLETYDLEPAPKVIEVNLRDDANAIQKILKRITNRSTFPNVLIHGRSIGGSDEMQDMHLSSKLRRVFEDAGIKVKGLL